MSVFVRPWYFSGSTCRLFESSVTEAAFTEISPVLVRKTSPRMPIMSPISYFLKSL